MQTLKHVALQGLFRMGAPAILRRLPARGTQLIVLAYHSVTDDPTYALPGIRVTPKLFAEQIAYLSKHYAIVDLGEATAMMRDDRPLPDRAVAITFDDGYRDNFEEAYPVLTTCDAPATIFATVSPVLDGDRFWVSWIYEVLVRKVDADAIRRVFGVEAGDGIEDAFNAISRIMNYKAAKDRADLLDAFAEAMETSQTPPRMLTPEHMREMQNNGIRFGSHTLSHPILANLDAEERQAELTQSRRRLSDALERPVDLIAYPNGRSIPRNYDDAVMEDCRAAGYVAAVTSKRGPVTAASHPYALPRMGVSQHGGLARFAITLERFRARASVPQATAQAAQ